MNIEELETAAESLRGQQVLVGMKAGDKFLGILSSVRTNTVTFKKAVDLTDENGKSALIMLELIQNIEKID